MLVRFGEVMRLRNCLCSMVGLEECGRFLVVLVCRVLIYVG